MEKKPFNSNKLFLYAIIIVFIAYFFAKNSLDFSVLKELKWTGKIGISILLALSMLALRDLGYVLRLRLLTDKKISIRESLRIILLWEFGSAITPGMIGGKAVAIYLLIKNKIRAAQASSIVLLAILLDEFIFVMLFPVFYFSFGAKMLHGSTNCPDWIRLREKMPIVDNVKYLESMIFIMLAIILIFVLIVFIGIFLFPRGIRNLIRAISRIRILKRWNHSIAEFADEIFSASKHIRSKGFSFWTQVICFTFISWLGRYLVGVAIVWGFANSNFDLLEVYVKQYALWLMFYVPSTPGSSGIAETLYMAFYCEYILTGMSSTAAFLWRFMSYYVYLIIGFVLLFFGGEKKIIED